MLYHAYKPQTILDFLDLKYSTSTTHYSVDVSVDRGFATDAADFTTPDFVHVHVTNAVHMLDIRTTLEEIIRHADNLTQSMPCALELLQGSQLRIQMLATSWTRQSIYQEIHNHRDGLPSIFLFARASLDDQGLVDVESMDYDLIFVRSRITIEHSVPTMA
jgi:hypothetical protein